MTLVRLAQTWTTLQSYWREQWKAVHFVNSVGAAHARLRGAQGASGFAGELHSRASTEGEIGMRAKELQILAEMPEVAWKVERVDSWNLHWLTLEIRDDEFPLVFAKGYNSSVVVSTLEALAVLVALKL